jgi:hypothetical protein
VFKNRAPRKIFGLQRVEVIEDWRKLHNEKLHNFHYSPCIIKIIKSRRMMGMGM